MHLSGQVRLGVDVEPARLAAARLYDELARLVIETSKKRSSARLAGSSSQLVSARELATSAIGPQAEKHVLKLQRKLVGLPAPRGCAAGLRILLAARPVRLAGIRLPRARSPPFVTPPPSWDDLAARPRCRLPAEYCVVEEVAIALLPS